MQKKGQGLSMNVIIIAALALLVLVILAVVYMNKMGGTVTTLARCESNGGKCVDVSDSCAAGWSVKIIGGAQCLDSSDAPDPSQKCCTAGE